MDSKEKEVLEILEEARKFGLKDVDYFNALELNKWCGFKHNQPTLFYLDLSYNYFDWEPVKSLIKSFTDELFWKFTLEQAIKENF